MAIDPNEIPKLPKLRPASFGDKIAERISKFVGSWPFIIGQTIFMMVWFVVNIILSSKGWDPYPFILMNLFLSTQAAYTAPLILMAERRTNEFDRRLLHGGYEMDKNTRLAIVELNENLNRKLDELIAAVKDSNNKPKKKKKVSLVKKEETL